MATALENSDSIKERRGWYNAITCAPVFLTCSSAGCCSAGYVNEDSHWPLVRLYAAGKEPAVNPRGEKKFTK